MGNFRRGSRLPLPTAAVIASPGQPGQAANHAAISCNHFSPRRLATTSPLHTAPTESDSIEKKINNIQPKKKTKKKKKPPDHNKPLAVPSSQTRSYHLLTPGIACSVPLRQSVTSHERPPPPPGDHLDLDPNHHRIVASLSSPLSTLVLDTTTDPRPIHQFSSPLRYRVPFTICCQPSDLSHPEPDRLDRTLEARSLARPPSPATPTPSSVIQPPPHGPCCSQLPRHNSPPLSSLLSAIYPRGCQSHGSPI